MKKQHYYIYKKGNEKSIVCLDYDKIPGYKFTPKNQIEYDGVKVNKLVVINPTMIEKVLKRKIKNKLDLYLKLIINFIESDDSDSGSYREALNDLSKYKSIVINKYQKYLDEKYLNLLMKKIEYLEYELNRKKLLFEENYEEELEREVHRRR